MSDGRRAAIRRELVAGLRDDYRDGAGLLHPARRGRRRLRLLGCASTSWRYGPSHGDSTELRVPPEQAVDAAMALFADQIANAEG